MRIIAEFIARGRIEAIGFVLLASWIPVLPQAAVCLITLRKGTREGLIVALAAMVPLLVILSLEELEAYRVAAAVGGYLVAYIASIVLRETVSWSVTLFSVVALSGLSGLLAGLVSSQLAVDVGTIFDDFLKASSEQNPDFSTQLEAVFAGFTSLKASGVVALWSGLIALAGLLAGRWFQAMLYNPGGFKSEFHHLRLDPKTALICALLLLLCTAGGADYIFWSALIVVPPLLAGTGFMHLVIANLRLGYAGIVVLYMALLLFNPLLLLLVLIGLVDAWIDFRKKFQFKQ